LIRCSFILKIFWSSTKLFIRNYFQISLNLSTGKFLPSCWLGKHILVLNIHWLTVLKSCFPHILFYIIFLRSNDFFILFLLLGLKILRNWIFRMPKKFRDFLGLTILQFISNLVYFFNIAWFYFDWLNLNLSIQILYVSWLGCFQFCLIVHTSTSKIRLLNYLITFSD
jgi:hypothetical protein